MKKESRIKRAAVANALWVVAIAGGLATAAPAFAGACSETGGDNNRLMWTGSSYTCAYVASSGNKSIGIGSTQHWSSSTAKGYTKKYNCDGQSGGVTVTNIYTNAANTGVGSSITYTALNTSSGSRHWNAAVLWATAGVNSAQYVHSCSTNYSIAANLSYIAKIATAEGNQTIKTGGKVTYTVTVTAPDGGGTPQGSVALFQQAKGSTRDQLKKDCALNVISGTDVAIASATLSNGKATLTTNGQTKTTPAWAPGTYYVYAVYTGWPIASNGAPAYCIAPPGGSGLTGALQSNSPIVTVTN